MVTLAQVMEASRRWADAAKELDEARTAYCADPTNETAWERRQFAEAEERRTFNNLDDVRSRFAGQD
jgi:predicted lipoprotein